MLFHDAFLLFYSNVRRTTDCEQRSWEGDGKLFYFGCAIAAFCASASFMYFTVPASAGLLIDAGVGIDLSD